MIGPLARVSIVSSLVVLLSAGCAGGRPTQRSEVLAVGSSPEVRAEDLSRCESLGTVEGVGIGGWGTMRDQQQYWARRDAVNAAGARGATNVEILGEGGDVGHALTVQGVAYRCR